MSNTTKENAATSAKVNGAKDVVESVYLCGEYIAAFPILAMHWGGAGMNIIPVSRDISGSMIEARGGYVVSVFHHPTNRTLYGFERSSEDALGWLYASRLIFDTPEGSA